MQLPAELREKIETLLGSEDRKTLTAAATDVSLKYRRENTAASLQISSPAEAKAYIATRLPATWCAVSNVLQRLLEIDPDFMPAGCIDLGAGPGTATLAAQNIWPGLDAQLVEPNANLRAIGQQLVEGTWQNASLQNVTFEKSADLTIASYVFNEIESDFTHLLRSVWDRTDKAFVMIEPGTPHGYATILKARDYFLSINANIAAPCPHHLECPLRNTDRWCHFSVRVDRSKLHLQIKADARLSYEDEKFSYLVVTRYPTRKPRFRALGEPHGQKVISLETCQSNGAFEITQVSKRSDDYKTIRKMNWGDVDFHE